MQRTERGAPHDRVFRGLRRVAGLVEAEHGKGVEQRVRRLDPRDAALEKLDRRDALAANQPSQLRRGKIAERRHVASFAKRDDANLEKL